MRRRAELFRRRLRGGPPLLLDGATGTELNRRGVDTALPLWSAAAVLEAPGTLLAIHRDYVGAGAEIITANTFRTHRRTLEKAGWGDRARELTEKAVELARAAVDESRAFVAGSLAPLEDCYSPDLVPSDAFLAEEHGAMSEHLASAGVDLILVETMNTIREAKAAARAARATGLPTLVGVVCGRDGSMLSGERVSDAGSILSRLEPDGLIVNCAPAPDLSPALAELAASSDLPVGAYGNVGYADEQQGWVNTDSVDPDAYARYASDWIASGARVVGSCCGTGPAHTAVLRHLIDAGTSSASD